MNGLFQLLYDGLPVGPSETLPTGQESRGWTLRRENRHVANVVRFDWFGSTGQNPATALRLEEAGLRLDVLAAASRIAAQAGFEVEADDAGLIIVAPQKVSNTSS